MAWYSFSDQVSFTTWHDTVCASVGIPYINYRQSDLKPIPNASWTTAYAMPVLDKSSGLLLVQLDPSDPNTKNLTLAISPVFPTDLSSPSPVTSIAFSVSKLTPPTWTDPNTNITYSTATGLVTGSVASGT